MVSGIVRGAEMKTDCMGFPGKGLNGAHVMERQKNAMGQGNGRRSTGHSKTQRWHLATSRLPQCILDLVRKVFNPSESLERATIE